jgi:hypothetical protein
MNTKFDLVSANRQWLIDEATVAERFFHSYSEKAATLWRVAAQERLAARQAANTPW